MIQDESEHIFRNHPSVIAGHILTGAIALFVMFFAILSDQIKGYSVIEVLAVIVLILVAVAVLSYFYWKRTFYIFEINEIHVTRSAIWKMDKHIQYTRLASVGVRRSIVDRIFGTSTLTFNVNSSMNATAAEATLVLKKDMADRLRNQLNELVFQKQNTVQDDMEVDTLIHVSNGDVIIHAILGQPTYQALFGLAMLFYAVVMVFVDNSGGLITALILLVISEVMPFVSVILRYYNYRIYRVGDTVTVEGGLITTRRSSFKVNKINSVRMREPLLARLFHRSMLEAEVVGMADDDSRIPLLCPLKNRDDVRRVMFQLVPEFVFEAESEHQPRRALIPMVITDTVFAVIVIGICVALLFTAETYLAGMSEMWTAVVRASEILAAIVVPLIIYGHSGMAQKHRTFDMGEDSFLFVYGGYDICTEYINYDKVQSVAVTAGPLQRAFGVAKCEIRLMSSMGFKEITSGLFEPDDLEMVGDTVMARIRDGRYDYRKYY